MGRNPVFTNLADEIRRMVASYRDGWELDPIRSYARRFNVSPTTVSKALAELADQGMIQRQPRGRYVRTRAAGWLGQVRRYPVIGLLTCTALNLPDDGYVPRLLRSFLETIQQRGIPACVFPHIGNLAMKMVPGGLELGPTRIGCSAVAFLFGHDERRLAELVQHGLVVMTLDYLSSTEGVDSVVVDCQNEAQRAVHHLAGLGHRHIAFLGSAMSRGPKHWQDTVDPDIRHFAAGVLAAKQALGLDCSPHYHEICRSDSLNSDVRLRQTLQRLMRNSPAPTAIITFSAAMASQTRGILREWGIHCPQQVSILTRASDSDDTDVTRLVADPRRIGGTAAQHIVDRLNNLNCQPTRLLFPSTLIQGTTTAPPATP